MTTIKFEVLVSTYETSEADPDDKWSRASTDGDVSIVGAKIVKSDGYDCLSMADEVQQGDRVWLVWAQYSTGDSFGSDGGQYELLQVCASEGAANERKTHFEGVKDYSVPWNGYFEDLDGIYVQEFVL